jgi:hypothetical protein
VSASSFGRSRGRGIALAAALAISGSAACGSKIGDAPADGAAGSSGQAGSGAGTGGAASGAGGALGPPYSACGEPGDAGASQDAGPGIDPGPGVMLLSGAEAERYFPSSCLFGDDDPPTTEDWSRRLGGAYLDGVSGLAVGADGTIFLTFGIGVVSGDSVDLFGTTVPASPNEQPTFLSSLSATGTHRWSRQLVANGVNAGHGVVATADGGAALLVTLQDSDAGLSVSDAVARFDAEGNVRWLRMARDTQGATASLAAAGDELFLASIGASSAGDWQRIEKLSASGETLWRFELTPPPDTLMSIAPTSAGEVTFALGLPSYAVSLGTQVFQPAMQGDLLVGKLDADGRLAWAKEVAGNEVQVNGLAASPDGGLLLAGWTFGPIDFGGGPLGSAGVTTTFAVKLDGQGRYLAARNWNIGANFLAPRALPSGEIFFATDFAGAIDVGGTPLHTGARGDLDFMVVETSPTLDVERVWHFGNGGGDQTITALALDPGGALVLTGNFEGHLDLGSGALWSAGRYDVFLGKLHP